MLSGHTVPSKGYENVLDQDRVMVTQHCQCANVYSVLGLYTLTYTVYNVYSVLELYALKYLQ